MAKYYRLHIRMPSIEAPPRDFEATVSDDNGWAIHGVDEDVAQGTALYLALTAEDYAPDVTKYLPDNGRLWAEAILLAFPSSEIISAPPIISQDDDGTPRVY